MIKKTKKASGDAMKIICLLMLVSVCVLATEIEHNPFFKKPRVEEEENDDITILNRLNYLQLDLKDEILFDLSHHFYYNNQRIIYWDLSNDYRLSIQTFVKVATSNYDSYLKINTQALYEYLNQNNGDKNSKCQDEICVFSCVLSLSYEPFEKDPVTGKRTNKSYTLSQNVEGSITDYSKGQYILPSSMKYLNYRMGSTPLLPYSYKNILRGDLSISPLMTKRKCIGIGEYQRRKEKGTWIGDNIENVCDNIGKFVPEEQESEHEQKYDLDFKNIPADEVGVKIRSSTTNELFQWSSQLEETPIHWKIHKNQYMMYITSSVDYPMARVYRIDDLTGKLVLLKILKLSVECKAKTNSIYYTQITTYDLNQNSIILRCQTNDPEVATYFYRFSIVDKIVMIEKQKVQPCLKECSEIYYGSGLNDYIPKMACVQHQVIADKVTPIQQNVIIFEVYDEPLEFRQINTINVFSLAPDGYADGHLGFDSTVYQLINKVKSSDGKFAHNFIYTVDQIVFSAKDKEQFIANMILKLNI